MNTFLITNKEKIYNPIFKNKIKFNKFYFYSDFTPIIKKKIIKKLFFLAMFMGKQKTKKLLKFQYQKSLRKYF